MKQLYLLALIAIFSLSSFAQTRQPGPDIDFSHKAGFPTLSMPGMEAVNDTLEPTTLPGCNPGPVMSPYGGGGYINGTNSFGDIEKAQRIETSTTGTIHSVLVAFGAKQQVGNPDPITAKIYSVSSAGAPENTLATSAQVTVDNIDTAGSLTQFSFPTPVAYNGDFFISVVVDGTGGVDQDTIGILHTATASLCGGGSAYELWFNFLWYAFNDDVDGWGIDIVMYMFAEVETSVVGENDRLIQRGSHKMVPSPAADHTMLVYSLLQPGDVQITITDMNGRSVLSRHEGQLSSGLHNANINVSNLAAGMYLYTVTTNGQPTSGTFVVAR
jgi:hypothetical protein